MNARNKFAKLSAEQLDQLVEIISTSDVPKKISEEGDFDRHSIAIVRALGLTSLISVVCMVLASEIKSFIKKS